MRADGIICADTAPFSHRGTRYTGAAMVTQKTDFGFVRPTQIEQEMRTSYLDYAMSVIVARALPDVRDGLKPVQRRILYAMQEIGVRPNSSYKKSARLVGEVLGKFHPHGEGAVYDAMVRLAQPWVMRMPLVDGQGNFGSVDDDPPAAMRYTEARLAAVSEQMLDNLDQDTVDFIDNFDGTLKEPVVLPARLPNLLVNGASGIAVGMATNIPPHNPTEVCAAVLKLIDSPEAAVDELMRHVKGPDFPTGATIMGREGIRNAYSTGRGQIVVRAKADVEPIKRSSREQIVVSELPYQVNKASLIEKIANLVKERRVEGITEIRDESDRDGMRIVLELRGGAQPQVVLNNLYKFTAMQSSFSANMLALVDGDAPGRHAQAGSPTIHRVPTADRNAALGVRAEEGQGAGPHPGRVENRPGQSRRSYRAHPGVQGRRGGEERVDDPLRGWTSLRPKRSSTCSCGASRRWSGSA